MNGDIFGTQYKIMTKHVSGINTVSVYKLSSMTKFLVYLYKESVHPTHVLIKTNDSMHYFMGR